MLPDNRKIGNILLIGVLIAFPAVLQKGALAVSLDGRNDVPESDTTQVTQSAYQVEAKDEPLPQVLRRIRDRYSIRLCWEEIPKDEVTDRITVLDRVQELKEIQSQKGLSSTQASKLKTFQEDVDKGEGHFVIAWNEYNINGMYSADTVPELLDLMMKEGPYGWYEENGTYVIMPRHESRLMFPVTVDEENALLSEIFRMIADASPKDNPVRWSGLPYCHLGLRSEEVFDKLDMYRDSIRVPRLQMQNVPAITVLNRAVEAAGGQITWHLNGVNGVLTYKPMKALISTWEEEISSQLVKE